MPNSATFHRLAFEAVSDMIFLMEVGHDGAFRFATANPAYLRRTGLPLSRLIGVRVEDIVPNIDAQFVLDRFREAVHSGRELAYEERVELASGALIVETTLQPVRDEEGTIKHLLGVGRDITERQRMEKQLAENELRYRSLFTHHPDAGFVLDREGRITHMNAKALKLTGYGQEQLTGLHFKAVIAPTQFDSTSDAFHSVMRGESTVFETVVLHRDGRELQVQVSAAPIVGETGGNEGFIGIAKDVTARRASERRLSESEERYKKLVELLPNAVIVHTDGILVFCNKECATAFGASDPNELFGIDVLNFVHPSSVSDVENRMRMLVEEQSEFVTKELTYIRLDGTPFEVESTAAFIAYEGKPSVQVVFRDITERKKAEQQLREANDRLFKLSQVDGLTGIGNRRRFDEVLLDYAEQAAVDGSPISLIMMDIDAFKPFNDHYGHLRGDDCLRLIGMELEQQLKEGDLAARYGGEEFVVLLPRTGLWEAAAAAERIRNGIEGLGIVHDYSPAAPVVTVSLGVSSTVPASAKQVRQLLQWSDQAMYEAKNSGKNRVTVKQTE